MAARLLWVKCKSVILHFEWAATIRSNALANLFPTSFQYKKMKKLLILLTLLFTFGFANAQTKIYNGNYYGKKDVIGYFEAGKIYSGNYYGKKDVIGHIENGLIYTGNYYGKKDVVGYYEGGKIYNGNYYGKKDVIGYYEEGKIYNGNYYGKKDVVGYYEGGGASAAAAGFLLLL